MYVIVFSLSVCPFGAAFPAWVWTCAKWRFKSFRVFWRLQDIHEQTCGIVECSQSLGYDCCYVIHFRVFYDPVPMRACDILHVLHTRWISWFVAIGQRIQRISNDQCCIQSSFDERNIISETPKMRYLKLGKYNMKKVMSSALRKMAKKLMKSWSMHPETMNLVYKNISMMHYSSLCHL